MPKTPLMLALMLGLVACQTAPVQKTAGTASAPAVSPKVANLYMKASAAPKGSRQQQDLVRQMAETASNGKELLMVMRAGAGVFREDDAEEKAAEVRLHSMVASKMIKVAAVDDLTEFALRYPVNPEDARPLVERMMQLAEASSDVRVWNTVHRAAKGLKVQDLAEKAQAKAELIAGR